MTAANIDAHRVVASPASLDRATWPQWADVLRIAADEALVIHEVGADSVAPVVDDPHAIIEPESGFVELEWGDIELLKRITRHLEWSLPTKRPALAQGLVAGVPCKVWLEADDTVRLFCSTSHVHELEARL